MQIKEWIDKKYATKMLFFTPFMWEEIQDAIEHLRMSREKIDVVVVQQFFAGYAVYDLCLCKCGEYYIELTDNADFVKRFDLSEIGYNEAIEEARKLFLSEGNK